MPTKKDKSTAPASKKEPATKYGPKKETLTSPEYKTSLANAMAAASQRKLERRQQYADIFAELGISTQEFARIMNLIPKGDKVSYSAHSKVVEKLIDNPSRKTAPRNPNLSDFVLIQLLNFIKDQGFAITDIDFTNEGIIVIPER